ncbi:lysine--tRNA ligase [Candidatus Roizmanbacteria bacterium]|nr:lysine--tRNA ligase [Candidatus Roizmanbacteria bacterium]
MIWVDREVKKIKERNLKLEWVDDMKTPSGRIHVGALRGVVIHDLVYKSLVENNVKAKYTYVFDDHDPMDALPAYLEKQKWQKYMGMQLYRIPSPEKGYKSFAQFYAKEFQKVFESINCYPEIIWTSELYNSGRMNSVINEVLDGTQKIREIYKKIYEKEKPEDWYPFTTVCQKCKKVGTTKVYKWDGKYVYYKCLPHGVEWTTGCGHNDKISPFNGNGKIPWKIEWAAKWKVIGVTVEGAGKDHMSKGGSHDVASAVCKEVLHYPVPFPIPYEWFTIGGRKMSSSKGVGASAKEVAQILPAGVFRFLIVRTHLNTHLDFNPFGDTILNLFDDYDRCMNAYFGRLEKKIPKGKPGEVLSDFARIMELSAVKPLPKKRIFLPRFRTIVNLVKNKTDLTTFFEKQQAKKLKPEEKAVLEERLLYAQIYLKNYAEEKIVSSNKTYKTHLSEKQIKFLKQLADNLESASEHREQIQKVIFDSVKQSGLKPKEAFKAFYQALTGNDFGPKASDLVLEIGLENAMKRLVKVV